MVTVPPSGLRSKDLPSVRLKASAQRQPTAVVLYCFPYQDCFLTLEKLYGYGRGGARLPPSYREHIAYECKPNVTLACDPVCTSAHCLPAVASPSRVCVGPRSRGKSSTRRPA